MPFKILKEPFLEYRIGEHATKRGREAYGHPERNLVLDKSVEHPQQGKITLTDGFKEPIFLKESRVFRVSDKREMCVQDECD
jgi:hypothetical protein